MIGKILCRVFGHPDDELIVFSMDSPDCEATVEVARACLRCMAWEETR